MGVSKSKLQTIAIVAMVCDHLAWGFLDFFSVQAQVLHIIGRLTIPIMCFFIAEGFQHTSNLKKYITRMVLFWVISALPFYLFFGSIYEYRQNFIFDLLLGLLLLTVLEHKHFSKVQKTALAALIFVLSMAIGGWPVLPQLYILIFYYKKDFAAKAKWFCGTTVAFLCLLMLTIRLNEFLHFSHYDWVWYDKLYMFGFLLALPLLAFYKGNKGITFKYVYYCFYPLHFLILCGIKWMFANNLYYAFYLDLHLIIFTITFVIIFHLMIARPSRAQVAATVFGFSTLVYMFGFLLEITSDSLDVISTAISVEYFGELILFMGFTWFIAEFTNHKLPKMLYIAEGIITFILICLVITAPYNHIFYKDMYVDTSGPFPRIFLEYGPGFYGMLVYIVIICCSGFILCMRHYRQSTGIERYRIVYIMLAILCPWIPPIIRYSGISGNYEVTALGIIGSAAFISFALLRYGYFDSVQLASDNALNHGKEGILVINPNGMILYFNQSMHNIFPDIRLRDTIDKLPTLKDIFDNNTKSLSIRNMTYEMRIEPLLESGYVQGYMLWAIDMTEHYKQLQAAEDIAHTDPLTGLTNRNYFHSCVNEHLRLGGSGAMIMLDMDNFKRVNDTYGHSVGDKSLLILGNTMKKVAKDTHLCCRMGGDEFAMFIKNITEEKDLTELARDVIYSFKRGLSNEGYANITSVSIGIAILTDAVLETDNELYEELYRRADRALYASKNAGKDIYRFYSS